MCAESWEEKTVYGQVEEATVTGLRPATTYSIRLFAENELGRSKEGRVLQVLQTMAPKVLPARATLATVTNVKIKLTSTDYEFNE
jgi:chitodextrinase